MTLSPPTDTAAPTRLRCPRCTAPMEPLVLSTHRHARLTVDHCAGCRLVWFDALESVQLDALGWVRLLHTMEKGLARPLALSQVGRPACPRCSTPFKVVRNRTRYGAFAVQECPAGHGHLHSHAGLLAERGLVRPLGLPERQALARERRVLHCLNCGGPAAGDDVHCSWCGTALVVVDLPRLAHSLQVRDDAMGPSPTTAGRATAWPCRSCGAPLDPARDAACRSCGHLVVASGLPDLAPLLAETEAALAQAAAVTTRVRERFASGRRAVADAPAAVSTRRDLEPWGWAGWMPLVLLAAVALVLLGLVLGVGRTSPVDLLAQRLGPDPKSLWPLVLQHEQLNPRDDHRPLALAVLELQLRQLNGKTWPAGWRLETWLERTPDRLDMRINWQQFVSRALEWQPASEAELPPPAAVPAGAQLAPAAPGAWVERDSRSFGLWAPLLRNRSAEPVPVSALSARIQLTPLDGVAWQCTPADPAAPRWLVPGGSVRLACRTQVQPHLLDTRWSDAMHALRSGQPDLSWSDREHAGEAGLLALARHFAERHGAPAASLSWRARWDMLTGPRLLGAYGAGLLLGFVVFCGLARGFGERRAALGVIALSLPVFWWLSRGEGAAVPLLAFAGMSATALAVYGYRYGFRIYGDLVDRKLGRA